MDSLRNIKFNAVYILILPPSIEELTKRLRKRGTETEESIERRVNTGKEEIKNYKKYDYIITNFYVEETVKSILAIVHTEKLRVASYVPTSNDIKDLLG